MEPLIAASFAERTAEGARFTFDNGWACRLFVLDDALFRVLFVRPEGLREPRTWMVAPEGVDVPWEGRDRLDVTAFARPAFDVEERDNRVVVKTAALEAHVRLRPFGIDWSTPGRPRFAADRPTFAYQWSAKTGVVRHDMARLSADRYFGLGDKTGPLDKHGRRLRTLALDALGYDAKTGDPLYKHWPYLIARDGATEIAYGVFYDTLAAATFDLGCEHDNYHGFYRYCEIDGGDLDYYLFVGPRIRRRRQQIRRAHGTDGVRAALVAGLREHRDEPHRRRRRAGTACRLHRQRREARDSDQRVPFRLRLQQHRSAPLRVHVEPQQVSRTKGARRAIPARADSTCRQHQAVPARRSPGLRGGAPSGGAFVNSAPSGKPSISQFWDGEGAHVDFTHPEGVRWWQQSLARELLDYGILGWNDNNEYEIWDEQAASHGFGQPIPIERSRPLQPLLMTRATYEAQAARFPDERVFTVTRAGPPGIQRYAQTWSGDNTTSWHTLRWNIRMGLTMSLSGMFNIGHDVGGFAGPVPDPELLVRWTQSGAFSPRFIMNSWKAGGEVNTPWLHEGAIPIIRDWLRLRYRLIPYLYTLYWRAAEFGEPIQRPLFYEFDADPRAFADSDDFMLGPSLLVASVVEPGQRERSVYLPEGPAEWIDFWSGEHVAAGDTVVAAAPLERIPLFVPAGAMIPTTDTSDMRRLHDEPSRALRIFPGRGRGTSTFTLYEDDGLSHGHRDGDRAEIECVLEWTDRALRVHAAKRGRFPLPYATIRVLRPPGERRRLELSGEGVALEVGA